MPAKGPVVVEQGSAEPLAGDEGAVLRPVLRLAALVHGAPLDPLEDARNELSCFRRHDDLEGVLAEHLGRLEAEDALRRRIPAGVAEVLVAEEVADRHALDLELELGEGAIALRFGLLAVGGLALEGDSAGGLSLEGLAHGRQHDPHSQRDESIDQAEIEGDESPVGEIAVPDPERHVRRREGREPRPRARTPS
jgi:hypothetical protein